MFPKSTIILIVDDSKPDRMKLRNELIGLNFANILEAEDGAKGLLKITDAEKACAPVSLVISDWNMPVMSGLEFLLKIRATTHLTRLPFLMLTGNTELDEVLKAVNAGVSAYLLKPYTPESLKESLTAVWQRQKNKY